VVADWSLGLMGRSSVSAASMITAMNSALSREGIDDKVVTVGQFAPRGSTGGMFAGGLVGDEVGGLLGADSVGVVGGALAGARGAARRRGLPPALLVGVSDDNVYGFAGRSRSREPGALVFSVPRSGLSVSVRPRVNVRVLVLATPDGSSQVELEGSRLPITHSKDVIEALRSGH
jgi:hypothetical protein